MRNQIRGWVFLAVGFAITVWLAGCNDYAYAQQPLPSGTYYSPEMNLEAQDAAALGSARETIGLAAFSLTDEAIVKVLADRAQHGVAIRIYLDRGELQAECRGDASCARIPLHELIGLANVQIRVKHSKVLMHLKSYCVDSGLVRDGSANFSEQGESRQDNSATFSVDPGIAKAFVTKFAAMWDRPDNLTVAQAVAGT
jgi:phosphatidylserine/phosphatidylglycerophosphate/cardiolipin synthase-like enzyme